MQIMTGLINWNKNRSREKAYGCRSGAKYCHREETESEEKEEEEEEKRKRKRNGNNELEPCVGQVFHPRDNTRTAVGG